MSKVYGTPGYIPPEALNGEGYNRKSDVFSVGAVIFNMVTGKNVFPGKHDSTYIEKNRVCDVSHVPIYLDKVAGCSPNLCDLVYSMLDPDYYYRPTARDALLHPWYAQDAKVQRVIQRGLRINREVVAVKVAPGI